MAGRRQQATHTADRHRLGDPVERVGPQVFQGKGALHQPCRHGANHHRVGRGEALEPRRDVGRFPERQVLVPPATAHHPHHDRAGVDAEPHGELHTVLCRQTGIQGGDGLDNAQAGVHGAPGIVFMGRGVAKIDQQPIAEILGDMARVVLDDLGRGLLVGAHHRAQVFGVCAARRVFMVAIGQDKTQAGVHRTPGIVFMGCGIAKIDQQPIPEILGDMPA